MKINDVTKNQINIISEVIAPDNISKMSPVLFIGKAVTLFKAIYKGPIQELENKKDVEDMVSEYNGIISPKPVIISDLSNLRKDVTFLLLKVVEEAKFPVIILSTVDCVDAIILSRIKKIVKFPEDESTNNTLMSIQSVLSITEKDKPVSMDKFYAENCPQLYDIEKSVPYSKYRKDFIQVLGDSYDSK